MNCPVGLLIDFDRARAISPRKDISDRDLNPFAREIDLGRSIVGIVISHRCPKDTTKYCHSPSLKVIPSITPDFVIRALEIDFLCPNSQGSECDPIRSSIPAVEKIHHNKGNASHSESAPTFEK